MRYINIVFCIILLVLLSACKETDKERIVRLVKEWENKEIIYPNNVFFTIQGKDTIKNYSVSRGGYSVATYIDSLGCIGCKLQLEKWKLFIREIDSISHEMVPVNIFVHPENVKELTSLLKKERFNYPVCIDVRNSFCIQNRIIDDTSFRTFLLDKENKVVAIGNPVHNRKVKDLYMNIIQNRTSVKEKELIKTEVEVKEPSISLGHFSWQKEQKVDFTIYNIGKQPLVINDITTSCGCTSVDYSKEPVRPGDSISLRVTYKADKPEHFNKTITVYCNADPSLVHLKIIGDAE